MVLEIRPPLFCLRGLPDFVERTLEHVAPGKHVVAHDLATGRQVAVDLDAGLTPRRLANLVRRSESIDGEQDVLVASSQFRRTAGKGNVLFGGKASAVDTRVSIGMCGYSKRTSQAGQLREQVRK